MVTFSIGDVSDAIHEHEGAAEVRKLENPVQVVIGYNLPIANLPSKGCNVARTERGSSASARDATSLSKVQRGSSIFMCLVFAGHGCFSILWRSARRG
jgi:hypothetical protein